MATQLAAWTTEGLLRTATRYGGYVLGNPQDCVLHAYQRWALLRGATPQTDNWFPLPEPGDVASRGWLIDVPAMAEQRGSSPSTLAGLVNGRPTSSAGCQAMLRGLPIAALVGPAVREPSRREPLLQGIDDFARKVSGMTHDHPASYAAAGFAARLGAECLLETESFESALRRCLGGPVDDLVAKRLLPALRQAKEAPCVPQTLERLAPDKTGLSALTGGIYVAMSFPDVDTVGEALEFAGWAPDGDSVAAVAGAFLGAVHGYEALPTRLISRLELGWVMDALARDLALQTRENQVGAGWKSESPDPVPPLDPWWDTKYPGV